jgi:cellulose synthase/poly-beta-1,6-N-acetylglucosamine synthase-like glycosyltransferase
MSISDWILVGLAGLALVPFAVIVIEAFAALFPVRRSIPADVPRPRCAILIPAHDEETGIARTIATLQPQLRDGDRVLVVADNCADGTSAAARLAGAEAFERHDPERRGKGYALAFGLKHLEADPPEVVVLIDADTRALPGSLDVLVREAARRNAPVQGVFTDAPKESRGPREQWSAFALTFKNLVRPLGLHRLGLPCLLTGSGMAFPWPVLRAAEFGTGNIVEDMQLGIDLALAGHPPRFCPAARFESDDAPTPEAAAKRRTRWEHGHVFTLLTQAPRLLTAGIVRGRPRLLALALELCVPPLSLLGFAAVALLGICALWNLGGGSSLPLFVLGFGMVAGVAAILCSWLKFGRGLLSPKILVLLPVYVLWKLPIYLRLLVAPQRNWVRTERHPGT